MLATSARAFRPSALAFTAQSPALIVIEAHSPATELFSKHPILLAKIFNDLQLPVVHPPGDRRSAAVAKYRYFMQIQFSDHTGWITSKLLSATSPCGAVDNLRQWNCRALDKKLPP
jgi:hypothetical protein